MKLCSIFCLNPMQRKKCCFLGLFNNFIPRVRSCKYFKGKYFANINEYLQFNLHFRMLRYEFVWRFNLDLHFQTTFAEFLVCKDCNHCLNALICFIFLYYHFDYQGKMPILEQYKRWKLIMNVLHHRQRRTLDQSTDAGEESECGTLFDKLEVRPRINIVHQK